MKTSMKMIVGVDIDYTKFIELSANKPVLMAHTLRDEQYLEIFAELREKYTLAQLETLLKRPETTNATSNETAVKYCETTVKRCETAVKYRKKYVVVKYVNDTCTPLLNTNSKSEAITLLKRCRRIKLPDVAYGCYNREENRYIHI